MSASTVNTFHRIQSEPRQLEWKLLICSLAYRPNFYAIALIQEFNVMCNL